ncbi:hypothetical protein HGRIS_009261 [Hohenbuehelia grisea]|uniref:Uncharacterized protein n=1 Tax=Hohenbuehelia grisea TaxID=104357 RepID=A0ABR3J0Z9_9AGAR
MARPPRQRSSARQKIIDQRNAAAAADEALAVLLFADASDGEDDLLALFMASYAMDLRRQARNLRTGTLKEEWIQSQGQQL